MHAFNNSKMEKMKVNRIRRNQQGNIIIFEK
jgi:hypothetical protein